MVGRRHSPCERQSLFTDLTRSGIFEGCCAHEERLPNSRPIYHLLQCKFIRNSLWHVFM